MADFEAQIYPQKQQQVSEGGPSTAAVGAEELNERELPEAESELISCKLEFKNAISKCQSDLKFNEQMLEFNDQKIASLEASLEEERVKLQNLQGATREGAADDQVERLQAEYQEQDAKFGTMETELKKLTDKRGSMKQELDVLAMRDESLQKDKNQALIKIKEFTHAIDEHIESALIDKTINLGDEIEDPQALEKSQIVAKITEILDTKGEIDTEVEKTVDSLKSLEKTYFKKVRDLEAIEEKFN